MQYSKQAICKKNQSKIFRLEKFLNTQDLDSKIGQEGNSRDTAYA